MTFSVLQACTSAFIWTRSMCIWWSAHGLLCHLSQVQILKRCAEYPEQFETTSCNQLISKRSLILPIRDEDGGGICRLHVVHATSNVKVQRSMFICGVYEIHITVLRQPSCGSSPSPQGMMYVHSGAWKGKVTQGVCPRVGLNRQISRSNPHLCPT